MIVAVVFRVLGNQPDESETISNTHTPFFKRDCLKNWSRRDGMQHDLNTLSSIINHNNNELQLQ